MENILSDIINHQRSFEYPRPKDIQISFSENLAERTEEYRKILKEMLNTDTILTAQETVSLGLADSIFELPAKSWHHFKREEKKEKPKKQKKN